MSKSETVQEVEAQLTDELKSNADEAGIDVAEHVENAVENYSDYSPNTIARFASSALSSALETANAEETKGLVVGSRDRYDSKAPRNFSLLREDGHMEIDAWSGSLDGPDGVEVEIPQFGRVNFKTEYDADYDSYQAQGVESVERIDSDELLDELGNVAEYPADITRKDEGEVKAIKGRILWVDPVPVFEGSEKVGDRDVLLTDESGTRKPALQISLDEDGDTRVRGEIGRQRNADPLVAINDARKLFRDAFEGFDDPEGQAGFLQTALAELDVVLVGRVWKINRNDGTKYVNMNLSAVVSREWTGPNDEDPDDAPSIVDEADDESDEGESSDDDTDGDSDESAASDETADEATDDDVAEAVAVRETLENYCAATGESLDDLTVDDVTELKGIDADEDVIRHVLSNPDGSESDGSDSSESPIEACKVDGVYSCPAESCLFSEGSAASLKGHISSAHSPGNVDEWIAEQVE